MEGHLLLERSFQVGVTRERAWELLADIPRWPEWAPHIRTASIDTPHLGPDSRGRFVFRPVGWATFQMTSWQPPESWTWHGRVLGLPIDYVHQFQGIDDDRSQLTWRVELVDSTPDLRSRIFTAVYTRNLDRAWPGFVEWAERSFPLE